MVKHDENKDLRSLARIAKINPGDKTIQCSKNAIIGIHLWGKIDFLTRYCGWHFVWNNSAGNSILQFSDSNSDVKAAKKDKKEHPLKNKKK